MLRPRAEPRRPPGTHRAAPPESDPPEPRAVDVLEIAPWPLALDGLPRGSGRRWVGSVYVATARTGSRPSTRSSPPERTSATLLHLLTDVTALARRPVHVPSSRCLSGTRRSARAAMRERYGARILGRAREGGWQVRRWPRWRGADGPVHARREPPPEWPRWRIEPRARQPRSCHWIPEHSALVPGRTSCIGRRQGRRQDAPRESLAPRESKTQRDLAASLRPLALTRRVRRPRLARAGRRDWTGGRGRSALHADATSSAGLATFGSGSCSPALATSSVVVLAVVWLQPPRPAAQRGGHRLGEHRCPARSGAADLIPNLVESTCAGYRGPRARGLRER
mgnify:CR=1 FL=1